jgi:hypothetical protein
MTAASLDWDAAVWLCPQGQAHTRSPIRHKGRGMEEMLDP